MCVRVGKGMVGWWSGSALVARLRSAPREGSWWRKSEGAPGGGGRGVGMEEAVVALGSVERVFV